MKPLNTISWVIQNDVPDPVIGFVIHNGESMPHVPITRKSQIDMNKLRELYALIGEFLEKADGK